MVGENILKLWGIPVDQDVVLVKRTQVNRILKLQGVVNSRTRYLSER